MTLLAKLLNRYWAITVLWWNGYCSIHLLKKEKYFSSKYCGYRYYGRKCYECAEIWGKAKYLKEERKRLNKKTKLENALGVIRGRDTEWKTLK